MVLHWKMLPLTPRSRCTDVSCKRGFINGWGRRHCHARCGHGTAAFCNVPYLGCWVQAACTLQLCDATDTRRSAAWITVSESLFKFQLSLFLDCFSFVSRIHTLCNVRFSQGLGVLSLASFVHASDTAKYSANCVVDRSELHVCCSHSRAQFRTLLSRSSRITVLSYRTSSWHSISQGQMQLTISFYGVLPADRYDLAPIVVQYRCFLVYGNNNTDRFNPQDE